MSSITESFSRLTIGHDASFPPSLPVNAGSHSASYPTFFSRRKAPNSGYQRWSPLQRPVSNPTLQLSRSLVESRRPFIPSTSQGIPVIVGDPDGENSGPTCKVTLDVGIPPEILQLFWKAIVIPNEDILRTVNAALSRTLIHSATDYGWMVQMYYTLFELYDGIWAQFVVESELKARSDVWKQALISTIRLISANLLKLEQSASSFVQPLKCIKNSRVLSYSVHHPFRLIQDHLVSIGNEQDSGFK